MSIQRLAKLSMMVCVGLAGIHRAGAQLNLSDPIAEDTSVVIGKLDNGLTYFIKHNNKPDNKVELRLVLKAGSILENDNQQGLAHFMEHMEFNGLKHFPKNALVNYLQDIGVRFGADLNANTAWDRTYFLLPIPTDDPKNLRNGFQIVSDWAGGAIISDEEVNNERKVIAEELRMRNKNAQSRMMQQFLPDLLNGSRYAYRQPGGKDSIVLGADPQLIKDFYKDWYRPNLMAVVVVGDLATTEAQALVKEYFGKLSNPANEREREIYTVAPYTATKAKIITDPEATSYGFTLSYPAKPAHKDLTLADYKQSLIRSLFSQSLSRKFRDMKQVANPPFAQAGLDLGGAVAGLTLSQEAPEIDIVPVNDLRTSIFAAIGELKNIATYGFSESDIETSKKVYLPYYENAYKERNDRQSSSFTDGFADAFMKGEPYAGIENEYHYIKELLPTITTKDVNDFAKEVLQKPAHYFAMITGPQKGSIVLPTEEGLIAMIDSAYNQQAVKDNETTKAATLLDKSPVAGKIVKEAKDAQFGTTTFILSNGVEVTVKPTDYQKDQVLLSGIKQGGTNSYGVADKSNTTFLGSVISSMGYGSFTPTALSDFLSDKRASANAGISGLYTNINGSSSVKDLETLFQLVYLQVTAPRKDTLLYRGWYNQVLSRLPLLSANPQNLFSDSLNTTIYHHDPKRPLIIPTKADLDNINVDRMLEIYKEHVGNVDGMHFFIVGNVNPDSLKPLLETYIASLPSKGTHPHYVDNGLRLVTKDTDFKFYKGQDEKSTLIDMYYGDVKYSPDLALKADMLAQAMTIQVLDTIREKMQVIYSGGVSGSVAELPYGHYSITAQMPCGPESVEKIYAELDRQAKGYKTNGVSATDLNKVKKAMIEQYKDNLKNNGTWLNELQEVKFWGHDPNNFLDFEKRVNSVTSEDLKNVAKLLLSGHHLRAATFPEKSAPKK